MNCQTCKSNRIIEVNAKCADGFWGKIPFEYEGYVPAGIGIGGGDYIQLKYCLTCGQIQGKFRYRIPTLKLKIKNKNYFLVFGRSPYLWRFYWLPKRISIRSIINSAWDWRSENGLLNPYIIPNPANVYRWGFWNFGYDVV